MAGTSKAHLECIVNGDQLEFHVHATGLPNDMIIKMKLDEESEIKTPDGRHLKVENKQFIDLLHTTQRSYSS